MRMPIAAICVFFFMRQIEAAEPVWKHGAVAADHPLASQAGVEILKQGGNVVDAAVAVGFAQSVLRPGSSGLGGGGFMVIWNAERRSATTLDYRERAPAAATRDLFTRPGPDGKPASSQRGGKAVAVPGHVAGLCYALKKYGTMPLKKVLTPAIRYAEMGVPLDEHEVNARRRIIAATKQIDESTVNTTALRRGYLGEWKAGDRFQSPQLAALQALAKHGRDAFYKGEIGKALVEEVRHQGGILTLEDMATMDVVERKPLTTDFDELKIFSMPPPSSGGVALIESLNILRRLEATKLGGPVESLGHNSPEYLHVLTETMKHAFADRAEFLGDADFADVPVRRLTSPQYAGVLAKRILLDRTRPLEDYGRFLPVEDSGTTHFSVIDSKGNAVACTETINTSFGSWVVEPRFGIVLNNEMDDFAAQPGKPNAFGLVQSEKNAVGPRHKPLSSMTPTIAVRDGKAVFALGASGGGRIISATLQVFLNLSRFEMSPEKAVAQPRAHHQWLPNLLYLEPDLIQSSESAMKKRGHEVKGREDLGVSQVVARTRNGLKAKSDPRKHGRAAGY
jgi:gamma-glutamyltranspeptidase / glutathione hydrolase